MRVFSLMLVIVMTMLPVAATAITYPLTAQGATEAISLGDTQTAKEILGKPAYNFENDSPYDPAFSIVTPFIILAFSQSQARVKYEALSKSVASAIMASKDLGIDVRAFSLSLSGNDDAICVIKQHGQIIKATSIKPYRPVVVEFPAVGFRTVIRCEFSLPTLDLTSPMTIVIANADTRFGLGHEVSYAFDPTTIR